MDIIGTYFDYMVIAGILISYFARWYTVVAGCNCKRLLCEIVLKWAAVPQCFMPDCRLSGRTINPTPEACSYQSSSYSNQAQVVRPQYSQTIIINNNTFIVISAAIHTGCSRAHKILLVDTIIHTYTHSLHIHSKIPV